MALTTIEKVIFLQDVDVFQSITTEDLAHLASITEEIDLPEGAHVYREGDHPDSMYMVIDGVVKLHRDGVEVMRAGHKDTFGTWALFDDQPRVASATVLEPASLLRIDRDEFYDLLADHTKITQGILKVIASRLRSLMSRIG